MNARLKTGGRTLSLRPFMNEVKRLSDDGRRPDKVFTNDTHPMRKAYQSDLRMTGVEPTFSEFMGIKLIVTNDLPDHLVVLKKDGKIVGVVDLRVD